MRLAFIAIVLSFCGYAQRSGTYIATAYSIRGTTADGHQTHRGTVAADPAVLPFGTRIRVMNAGPYSGIYVVQDEGRRIRGRKLDVYMPSVPEARHFGKRRVRVRILKVGSGSVVARR